MDRDLSNRVCTEPPTTVRELQATLFPPMSSIGTGTDNTLSLQNLSSNSFLGSFLLKSNQVLVGEDRPGAPVARLKDPRDLFALGRDQPCPAQQAARWPAECQVIDERVEHIEFHPPAPEPYYSPNNREATPKPLGEEYGTIVYQYYPTCALNYFNRSCTGGIPNIPDPNLDKEDLHFESRFESGNLAKAIKLTPTFYELYVRTDMYTNRYTQWFYFQISNTKRHVVYRFSIVNLSKGESLYTSGMKPLMYSTKEAKLHSIGWRRCGENVAYFCNENGNPEEDQPSNYTLTFTLEFPHDADVVYIAHSYPYTYTDLQDYLLALANHPVKSAFSSLRLLCRTLAGNNVYYVTVTSPSQQSGDQKVEKKKAIVITARVHPGETPASWMMKGLLDFLTGDTGPARDLRDKFIFKLVPMLNPDGVIVGNSRCSLTGRDLNRQYRTVIRDTYPSIWHTKLMVRRLLEECGVALYCDFHAHSRQNNIFIYGCENRKGYDRYLQEQIFPLMLHKNACDKFSFENCRFRVHKAKEGTGRVVMWMMGICHSYTLEASFSGSDLGPRVDTHFTSFDYEQMGRAFCQTLLDFYDESPNKARLRCKILKKLLKEGSSAEEPTNVILSDYSSDEGSSSDESDKERDSPPLIVPPPSPNHNPKNPKKKNTPSVIKAVSKSPTVQRKILPMYHTTLGLSLAETDYSDSDTGNEAHTTRTARPKIRKQFRRKKKKNNKIHQEHSDTELQVKKHTKKSLSVMELIPAERLRSQSWNRFAGFPLHKTLDIRHLRNTTRQLAEVQEKLRTLRRKIWVGLEDGDHYHHQPLSWGHSNFNDRINNQARDLSKTLKDAHKKSKSCDEDKKTDKKLKKKSKKQKEETKKPPQKKKSNGIKRQTAVDWSNYDNRRQTQTVKSKSLQENGNGRILPRSKSATVAESCAEADKKKPKKKKKRKGNWEKNAKAVVNVNNFVRKTTCP